MRYKEIDFWKFFFIIWMILIHIVHFNDTYPALKDICAAASMPGFMLISGYLCNIQKKRKDFLKQWLSWFGLYAVMELGFSILSYFMPVRDGLTELSVGVLLDKLFINPLGPYWYLRSLFICQIVYYLVFNEIKNKFHISLFGSLLLIIGVFLLLISYIPHIYTISFYFCIGVILRQCNITIVKFFRPSLWAVLLFVTLLFLNRFDRSDTLFYMIFVFSVFCLISWLGNIFQKSDNKKCTYLYDKLCYVGRNSLPIYIFHPVFTLCAKFLLPYFAFDKSALLYTIFTLLLSVVGSLLLAKFLEKSKLSYLLFRPKLLR